jgi:hypothetical protein
LGKSLDHDPARFHRLVPGDGEHGPEQGLVGPSLGDLLPAAEQEVPDLLLRRPVLCYRCLLRHLLNSSSTLHRYEPAGGNETAM